MENLYRKVDADVGDLERSHGSRLQCRPGCASCCVDDITVWEVEASFIRHHCREVLSTAPHPVGKCAFLDSCGNCRIYRWRPYVCRTQGLPLHWTEENEDGTVVAYRDICPVNDPGQPVETLPEDDCWKIGPVEEKLAAFQCESGAGKMKRVGLRELFGSYDSGTLS